MIVKDEGTFIKILTFIDSSKAAHSLFNDFEFDLEAILTPLERKKQKKKHRGNKHVWNTTKRNIYI